MLFKYHTNIAFLRQVCATYLYKKGSKKIPITRTINILGLKGKIPPSSLSGSTLSGKHQSPIPGKYYCCVNSLLTIGNFTYVKPVCTKHVDSYHTSTNFLCQISSIPMCMPNRKLFNHVTSQSKPPFSYPLFGKLPPPPL